MVVALAAAACGRAPSGDADAGLQVSHLAGCEDDPRVDAYRPGLERLGQGGALDFILVSSDPGPPRVGLDSFELEVRDVAGSPLSGATLTVTPYMPDHGHGSSVDPTVTPVDGGRYRVDQLYLFLRGIWTFTIDATAGGRSDTVVFTFCVER